MTERVKPPEGIRTIGEISPDAALLVLVRHGEAVANVEGYVGGEGSCRGLTATGRDQVAALGRRWAKTGEVADADGIISSTLRRAIETRELLSASMPDLEVLEPRRTLCELQPGEADGLSWQAYEERYGRPDWNLEPERPIAPGGESWVSFVERASGALVDLATANRGCRLIVCCHAGVIEASLIRFCYDAPPATRLQLRSDHASVTEWAYDGRWKLLSYNSATPVTLI